MIKMEPIVKKWYGFLDEGKLMGMKCKHCGSYEFPPVPICNNCSSTDVEWAEISGKGILKSFTAMVMTDPPFAEFGPQLCGHVELIEGPTFVSWLADKSLDAQAELYEHIPLEVRAEIQQRNGYKYPVFRIKE